MDFYIGFNMMIKSALAIVADKFFCVFLRRYNLL